MGGIVRAVELGWPQREIAASAYRTQRQIDAGERPIVGLNRHVVAETTSIPDLEDRHDPGTDADRPASGAAGGA